MKKKLLVAVSILASICMLGGCASGQLGDDEQASTEVTEESSDKGGLLEEIKSAVSGKFELKQESITLEMGTELGEISDYVDADNYDDITMEIEPPEEYADGKYSGYKQLLGEGRRYFALNCPSYIDFTRGEDTLRLHIEWTDTTPPEAPSNYEFNRIQTMFFAEEKELDIIGYRVISLEDFYFGYTDNSQVLTNFIK